MKSTNFIARFLPVCARRVFLYLLVALLAAAHALASAQTVEWIQQFGDNSSDGIQSVSADGLGNFYISGSKHDRLVGGYSRDIDAFVSKYDASGTLLWTEKWETSKFDFGHDVSADGLGNVYICGYTYNNLGGSNSGYGDAYISKYNALGSLLWTEQFGTSSTDSSYGVSADGLGNVYTSGVLGGFAFIRKYNAAGMLLWTKQLGTSGSTGSFGVSADGLGNVYISGGTVDSLGGPYAGSGDAYVSKYNASGTLLWTEQLGTSSYDESFGVSADELGNVYITGSTRGSLGGANAGGYDVFVSK